MTALKSKALDIAHGLYDRNFLDAAGYAALRDALEEIETLRDRDEALEELWDQFADVPMDPETERIEEAFMGWGRGISREEIWHWFDQRHSKGVAYLLYGDGIDRTEQVAKLLYLKQLCAECTSSTCQFNHGGECRFALVHERKPRITDDGCIDFDYQAED